MKDDDKEKKKQKKNSYHQRRLSTFDVGAVGYDRITDNLIDDYYNSLNEPGFERDMFDENEELDEVERIERQIREDKIKKPSFNKVEKL